LLLFFAPALLIAGLMPESKSVVPALVIATGCVGGFVGLQRRLKELSPSELELIASSIYYTALSPLVGGILALLLYIIFLSGLVSGQLFPNFVADHIASAMANATSAAGQARTDETFVLIFGQHGVGYQDYAKLIFWSFVAGFSERFVTDVISRLEGSAVNNAIKDFTK